MIRAAELHLPPDGAHVGLARLVVTQAARAVGMGDEKVEDLRIAVSEATTNAISAHAGSGCDDVVVLRFGVRAVGDFEVVISDMGPGFDPHPDPLAGRDWSVEGGLGITLIRGLADSVEFKREDGMQVHMRFELAASPQRESVPAAEPDGPDHVVGHGRASFG